MKSCLIFMCLALLNDSYGQLTRSAWLNSWPEPEQAEYNALPLIYDKYVGPYKNPGGEAIVEWINSQYRSGEAAGLMQDSFRSYCNNHSRLRTEFYPQLRVVTSTNGGNIFANLLVKPREFVFNDYVTFGVESHGYSDKQISNNGKCSVVEAYTRILVGESEAIDSKNNVNPLSIQEAWYTANFLFTIPALGIMNSKGEDRALFCSPYILHSIGASGTDSKLIKPIVLAAAALPVALKRRIIKNGLYIPTLMYLFKSYITGDLKDSNAHRSAYTLPAEAWNEQARDVPRLASMIENANSLTHIPPVPNISYLKVELTHPSKSRPETFSHQGRLSYLALLHCQQQLKLVIDLSKSWSDLAEGQKIISYYHKLMRGPGSVRKLNKEGSLLEIIIGWKRLPEFDKRTDILILVNDGTYDSSPAYISVNHVFP